MKHKTKSGSSEIMETGFTKQETEWNRCIHWQMEQYQWQNLHSSILDRFSFIDSNAQRGFDHVINGAINSVLRRANKCFCSSLYTCVYRDKLTVDFRQEVNILPLVLQPTEEGSTADQIKTTATTENIRQYENGNSIAWDYPLVIKDSRGFYHFYLWNRSLKFLN